MSLLAHRVDGAGEALLLLNGGLMSYAAWDPLVPAFAGRFRVVRCDLRGQLRSPGIPAATVAGNVAEIEALLDHLGVDRAHVVGTSFGGAVAVALTALAPGRVASLVAATVGPVATPDLRRRAAELAAACRVVRDGGAVTGVLELIAGELYAPAYVAAHAAGFRDRASKLATLPPAWWAGVVGILEALQRLDLAPLLPRVACPTLVLAAELDQLFPPEQGRALAAGIPGAHLAVVPGSGHVLIQERPDDFTRHCLDFLSSLAGSGKRAPVPGPPAPDPGPQPPEGAPA